MHPRPGTIPPKLGKPKNVGLGFVGGYLFTTCNSSQCQLLAHLQCLLDSTQSLLKLWLVLVEGSILLGPSVSNGPILIHARNGTGRVPIKPAAAG